MASAHVNQYRFFYEIAGVAMKVHANYRYGLLEAAYEAALKYLLEQRAHKVERQVFVPIYWEDVKLDQSYRLDLLIDDSIIVELKAIAHIGTEHRRQLWNYMNLTHIPYGMLINFSPDGLYSEWYVRNIETGRIDKIKFDESVLLK